MKGHWYEEPVLGVMTCQNQNGHCGTAQGGEKQALTARVPSDPAHPSPVLTRSAGEPLWRGVLF